MKYHATISTIVISIIVVLIFFFVASFTVFSLQILSPGYMISDFLLKKIPSLEPYTIKYDSLDSSFKDGININNVEIKYKDISLVQTDKIKISTSIYSLLKGYFSKQVTLDIAFLNLNIKLPFDYKELELPSFSSSNAEGGEKEPIKFDFSFKSDTANITYMDLISLNSLSFFIDLDPDFSLKNVKLQLDSFNGKYDNYNLALTDFRFQLEQKEKINVDLSVEKIELSERLALEVEGLRLNSSLTSLKEIDFFQLPIDLSLTKLNYTSDNIKVSSSGVNLSYKNKLIYALFNSLNTSYGDFKVNLKAIPFYLTFSDDSLMLDLAPTNNFEFFYKDKLLANLNSLNFEVSKADKDINFKINQFILKSSNLSKEINLLEAFNLNNTNLLLKYTQDKQLLLQGNVDTELTSTFKAFKNVKMPLTVFASFDSEFKLKEANVAVNNLDLFSNQSELLSLSFNLSEGKDYSVNLTNGKNFNLNATYSDIIDFRLEASNYSLPPYKELIATFVPALSSYIGDSTSLTSSISANYNTTSKQGKLNSLLTLSDIRFNQYKFSLSTNLDSLLNDTNLSISKLLLATDFFRAEYKGEIDLSKLLPKGEFSLSLPNSQVPLLNLQFSPQENLSYSFVGQIPRFESGYLKGNVKYLEDIISSNMELIFTNRTYPINFELDLNKKLLDIDSNGLLANVDYSDFMVNVLLSLQNFPIGQKTEDRDTIVSGELTFHFDIPKQQFTLNLPLLEVGPLRKLKNEPSVFVSVKGDNNLLLINRFDFVSEVDKFTGRGQYDFVTNTGAFSIGDALESLDFTFTPYEKLYTGIIDIQNLSLTRFGFGEEILNAKLIGRGGKWEDFEFSGNFNINPLSIAAKPWELESSILITKNKLNLSNVNFKQDLFKVTNAGLNYDVTDGNFSLFGMLNKTFLNEVKDHTILSELQLTAPLGKYQTLFEAGKGVLKQYKSGTLSTNIKIPYLIIDDEVIANERNITIEKNLDKITLEGNLLKGFVDISNFDSKLSLFGLKNVIDFEFTGRANPLDLNLDVIINSFDLYYLNTFFPIGVFSFLPDSKAFGKIKVVGNLKTLDFKLYGDVSGYELGMDVWWVPRQDIYLQHPTFHVWNNVITSATLPIITVDRITKEKKVHTGTLELSMQNSFMDYFRLDINTDKTNPVFVRVPIVAANVDAEAWVDGHFYYGIDTSARINLGGEITLNEGQFSIGLKELPSWWDPKGHVINDFKLTVGNNVSFLFPLSSNPILKANLKQDTKFSIAVNNYTNQKKFDGDIFIQSGQIFYFQKSFFITEGKLSINQTGNIINPRISLRARLRDFDTNNNKVDIYLILNNSTLDSINPSFESSPQKSNSEIMSILGNAILPTDTAGNRIENTVASLLTSSVDLLSRLGVVSSQTGDLNESIRKALNLDMFSLNSKILENFLIDSVRVNNSTNLNTSALSRYLNNTSIYLGKNISNNFFLQGIIHFASVSDLNDETTLFASDLAINTELSLEWTTPLGLVTFFTHPNNLTIYDTIRNFGISYTQRIRF